ncbi:hypothetical protein H5J25_00600 [Sphingomonas aliaeris]|uniref:Uncharacterized protein n=1 Tax=Sphingomonas aliaeris TaxID=2759526 RepID=A0A974NUS8_9SPHN|nr:hypothetical protein [Sphingomonas aliaeris]QQV77373.1 hypothetical protein H5J25_00600 [Sphingomonas aliaeris]
MAVGRHDDIRVADGIIPGLDPSRSMTLIADRPFATEAYKIDFHIPLPVAAADRATRIERAVPRQEGNDIEGVRAIRACA